MIAFKPFNITWLLFIFLFLAGCGESSDSITPQNVPPASTIGQSKPTISTPGLTPTLNTPSIIDEVEKDCLNVQEQPFPTNAIEHSIFYVSDYEHNRSYFWDIKTNETIPVSNEPPDTRIVNMWESPNHQRIAYQKELFDKNGKYVGGNLIVVDSHARKQAELKWDADWGLLRDWLDNERLLIQGSNDLGYGISIVVNPFTKQAEKLSPNLPHLYDEDPPAYWTPSYSLDLSYVVYPHGYIDGKLGYAYMDIKTENVFWEQTSEAAGQIKPIWSPDRSEFALILINQNVSGEAKDEIVIFDSSGQKIIQTNLKSKYSKVYIGNSDAVQWSPEKRYIALWLNFSPEDYRFPSLAILDLQEQKIKDLCISGYGDGNNIEWSPDGRYFITWSDKQNSNILIDVFEYKVYLLPAPGLILFWMRE